jgi:hypothetical protein
MIILWPVMYLTMHIVDNNLTWIGWTENTYRRKIPQLHDVQCVGVTGIWWVSDLGQDNVRFLIKGFCDGGP